MANHQLRLAQKQWSNLLEGKYSTDFFSRDSLGALVSTIRKAMDQAQNYISSNGGQVDGPNVYASLDKRYNAEQVVLYLNTVEDLSAYGESAAKAIASIRPDSDEEQLQSAINLAKQTAALKDVKSRIMNRLEFHETHYAPLPSDIDPQFDLQNIFEAAGLDMAVFANNARPKLADLLAMVHTAEKERGLLTDGKGAAISA